MIGRRLLAAALVSLVLGPGFTAAAAQDSFEAARALYAAAAYEDALAMLTRLEAEATGLPRGVRRDLEATRALCLLALDRQAETRAAMEAVVDIDPQFEFDEAAAAPRVRALLAEARARRLPEIIRQRYEEARLVYEAGSYTEAAARFDAVLVLLEDPVLARSDATTLLRDLRMLARDFHALSVKATGTAPAGATPEAAAVARQAGGQPPTPAADRAASPAPSLPAPTTGATGQTPETLQAPLVIPPAPLEQRAPVWSPDLGLEPGRTYQATVEVVIDESGRVTSARILDSITPAYDARLLETVRRWRYRPGTRDGVAVRFTKLVTVTVETRD